MPCEQVLENEEIIDIKSADFLSAALTKSGKNKSLILNCNCYI